MKEPKFDRIQDSELLGQSLGENHQFSDIVTQWENINLPKGSIVIIALPNSTLLLKLIFALLKNDYVPVMLSPSLPRIRLNEIISLFHANAIVKTWVPNDIFPQQKTISKNSVKIAISETPKKPSTKPGETILMTSGTSGISSGCVFDFSQLIKNAKKHANAIRLTEKDIMLINLPLYFSYAFVAQALASIVVGARLIISGPPFNLQTYKQTIKHYKVTTSSITPILARQMIIKSIKLPSCLKKITVGGDKIIKERVKKLLKQFPDKEIYITYGLTQAGPRVSTLSAHLAPDAILDSVGNPLPGTKITLDESHGPEGVGELIIESDTIMKRRIGMVDDKKPDELINGCLHTGDYFSKDNEGNLYFYSRKREFISINDEHICLASIKRIALQLPKVLSATIKVLEQEATIMYDLILSSEKPIKDKKKYIDEIHHLLPRSQWPHAVQFKRTDQSTHK